MSDLDVQTVLSQHPHIADKLDDATTERLFTCDPERACEIILDMATRGDVRNPSAYVQTALKKFPHKRGPNLDLLPPSGGFVNPENAAQVSVALSKYPRIRTELDENAMGKLNEADLARALEIIEEVGEKLPPVRNPSAFVCKALRDYPTARGGSGVRYGRASAFVNANDNHLNVDGLLVQHPAVAAKLDHSSLLALRAADPARAREIIGDMVRSNVGSLSAFVHAALQSNIYPGSSSAIVNYGGLGGLPAGSLGSGSWEKPLPLAPGIHWDNPRPAVKHDIEGLLASHPDIAERLDNHCRKVLAEATPGRAEELLQEVKSKHMDISNISAFISKAIKEHPHQRGRSTEVEEALERYPEIAAALDQNAITRLRGADAARAVEIIEEIALKGVDNIRNMSAFVAVSLNKFPHKRGGSGTCKIEPGKLMPIGTNATVEAAIEGMPHIASQLDEHAKVMLAECDPARALELLEEVNSHDIRNVSAFISKAIRAFPMQRGRLSDVEDRLSQYPWISRSLDGKALEKLRSAEPARALEVIQDMVAKGEVTMQNPSGFVVTALNMYPHKRGSPENDSLALVGGSLAKQRKLENPYVSIGPDGKQTGGDGGGLDDAAKAALNTVDPARAAEILEELALKGDQIRNASAFVCAACAQHKTMRGREY